MAGAAELSADAITVDLHCHPNLSSGRRLAEFDADVPDNMRAGGLDAGIFAVRGDGAGAYRARGDVFGRAGDQGRQVERSSPVHPPTAVATPPRFDD